MFLFAIKYINIKWKFRDFFLSLGFVYRSNTVGRDVLQKTLGHGSQDPKRFQDHIPRHPRCGVVHGHASLQANCPDHGGCTGLQGQRCVVGEQEGRTGVGLREAWEAEQGWRARPTAEAARGARGGALALTRCGALHGRGAEEEAEARGARGGGGAGRGGQACRGAEPRKAQHPRHPPLREEPEGADPPGRGDPDWGPARGGGAVPGAPRWAPTSGRPPLFPAARPFPSHASWGEIGTG